MPARWMPIAAVALALLAGCGRGADSGATANPNAPGRPGTGNGVDTAAPRQGDSQPGGPSGVAGSAPHPGSSGGDMVPGTTGRGTAEAGGRSATVAPGTGTAGGLGSSGGVAPPAGEPSGTGAMGAGPQNAPSGSTNRSTSGSVGNR